MIVVQELASLFKNSGFTELFSWIFGFRKTFPYNDKAVVHLLLRKGVIDTLSESLCCVSALVLWYTESKLIGYSRVLTVTKIDQITNQTIWSYDSLHCGFTCVGWRLVSNRNNRLSPCLQPRQEMIGKKKNDEDDSVESQYDY